MSLPQHKKSAEEIAKLREALGIPGSTPDDVEAPALEAAAGRFAPPLAATPPPQSAPASPPPPRPPVQPAPPLQEPEVVQLSKPSLPVPVLSVEISGPPLDEEHAHHPKMPEPVPEPVPQRPAPAAHGPKQVRSLRKSEQGPVSPPHRPPADSVLPVHRHSENDIKLIRRHEALAPHAHIPHPQTLIAHPVVYVPGYLLAIAGAVCCFYYDLELHYTAACEGLAFLLAAFIWFQKPLSRHHGGFIAVIALMVVVFGVLHYFPNLKYGT